MLFAQREDESLYKAWEYFKNILWLCPHHGLQKRMIVQTFYNGITHDMSSMTYATMGGTLMSKTEDKVYNLIEEMVRNNYQWSN